ncbi:MAG: carotenoid oxygenase family protein [Parachlamydiaceae bacterium]|nr:carotenoid oxygenase family protein [Parachlamydiaceae bacterium]
MGEKNKVIFVSILLLLVMLWVLPTSMKSSSPLKLGVGREETEKKLHVEGKLPDWLTGVLVRNSSIPVFQDGKQISHKFDGLAMLHGFAFDKGNVFYTNRFLKSQQHDAVFYKGMAQYKGFASEPSLWQKAQDFFSYSDHFVNNASVNVFKYGNQYVALTEVPLPACFDLKTLNTLGSFSYLDSLPKSKCWESAHPHFDASSNEIVNFLIEFGRQSYYVFYRMEEGSSSRKVIAKVPVDMPSYMHSFAMTENYLILTEFPFIVSPLDLLIKNKPFIHNFTWQPERGTRFIVLERSSGKIVSKMIADAFFSFHHANAYEIKNRKGIVLDLVASPDISQMPSLFPQATSILTKKSKWKRRLMRYHLSLDKNEILPEVMLERDVEFPRFDDKLDGKSYRYLYMTIADDTSTEFLKEKTTGLVKFDMLTKQIKIWSRMGCSAVEPIFIASPDAKNEDEGVVLSVVYDEEKNSSFLLVLDGQSFDEIAQAELPGHIPGSFHGQYFSESVFVPQK